MVQEFDISNMIYHKPFGQVSLHLIHLFSVLSMLSLVNPAGHSATHNPG